MLAEVHKATPEEAKEQRSALGAWLKELRENSGLSQRELADVHFPAGKRPRPHSRAPLCGMGGRAWPEPARFRPQAFVVLRADNLSNPVRSGHTLNPNFVSPAQPKMS